MVVAGDTSEIKNTPELHDRGEITDAKSDTGLEDQEDGMEAFKAVKQKDVEDVVIGKDKIDDENIEDDVEYKKEDDELETKWAPQVEIPDNGNNDDFGVSDTDYHGDDHGENSSEDTNWSEEFESSLDFYDNMDDEL